MCTVSWCQVGETYHVFVNRDESRRRGSAHPPAIRETAGVRFVAPIDPDGGGTWIGVNEFGVSLALLNLYGVSAARQSVAVSRGRLVTALLEVSSQEELRARWGARALDPYGPCHLVAFEPGRVPLVMRWDGERTTAWPHSRPGLVATSSAVAQEEADDARRRLFAPHEAAALTPDILRELHRSHHPERGPLSVCMHRPDAVTRAFSHILVSAGGIELEYADGAPCEAASPSLIRLPRRLASAA